MDYMLIILELIHRDRPFITMATSTSIASITTHHNDNSKKETTRNSAE